jgi:hypothetical protein
MRITISWWSCVQFFPHSTVQAAACRASAPSMLHLFLRRFFRVVQYKVIISRLIDKTTVSQTFAKVFFVIQLNADSRRGEMHAWRGAFYVAAIAIARCAIPVDKIGCRKARSRVFESWPGYKAVRAVLRAKLSRSPSSASPGALCNSKTGAFLDRDRGRPRGPTPPTPIRAYRSVHGGSDRLIDY